MSKTFGDLVGTDESLDVLVGTGSTDSTHELPQKFTLRCGSFLPRSEFLRKARRKMWNKSLKCWSEEPIMMADDRPSTFEEYARHVYFGTIFDSPEYEDSLDYKRIVQSHFSRMIRLYLLAEKRCDLKTSNLMLDEIYLYSQSGSYLPGRDVINEAYEATDTDSLLRTLLRDMMFYDGNYTHWPIGRMRSVNKEFSEALMIRFMEQKLWSGDALIDEVFGREVLIKRVANCRYHKHDGDEDEEESPKCVQLAFVKNDEDTMVARIRMRRANFR